MLFNLGDGNSLVTQYVAELRDTDIQADRMRFRTNLERIGEIFAYEISKRLAYRKRTVSTPLGACECYVLEEQPIIATILRAGLPLHQGLLRFFDKADNAFISAYRKHKHGGDSFDINLSYCSSPDIKDRVLIVSDPMLATGSSMVLTLEELFKGGRPSSVHIVSAIACQVGVDKVRKHLPDASIWCAALDPRLNDKSFIVPGLGDAGDLSFGEKIQS